MITRLPLGNSIISFLKPLGPLPRPLSPTVANVSRAILPFLTNLVVVCVCSVPVCNFGILSIPNLPPTQFKPSISLLRPFLIALTMPPIWSLILPMIDFKPSRIFPKILRTLSHKRPAIPTVLSLIEFQMFVIQFLNLVNISFVAFHKLVNLDLTPVNNE
ncbi:hypothetical protein IS125_0001 [Staphylococcus aureus subsp. aureus IS-125]|nr:hypothetical protein IS125_0001 [Staphylococcus aureus subsp. aureus IS-125]